jgi:T-complex protein 1 subunit gamma
MSDICLLFIVDDCTPLWFVCLGTFSDIRGVFGECQDAMGVARNVMKDAKLVPGGGASEMAVAAALKEKSSSIEGIEQV